MKSSGALIALSLIALLLTASATNAQSTITIPCSRVDEFVHGAIDVPAGGAVEVSAVTVSQLIARVGGPKNFAVLMRTPEGRRAVKDTGAISDEEFAWCKQRVQNELLRRQRAQDELLRRPREGDELMPRDHEQRPVRAAGWYLMVPPLDNADPAPRPNGRWITVDTLDTAAACEERASLARGLRAQCVAPDDPRLLRDASPGEWYLMRAPRDRWAEAQRGEAAPDAEWTRLVAYGSAPECQRARSAMLEEARATQRAEEATSKGRPPASYHTLDLGRLLAEEDVVLKEATQCVAAADPRLARTSRGARPGLVDEALRELVTVIPFTPGKPIYVDVRINDSATARLVLDTGADRTTITPRILRAAGSTPRGSATLRGVTGHATADVYEIASLKVGSAMVGRLTVFAHNIGERGVDGLLGRDFLDQFKVTIDSAAGWVTLSPK